MNNEKSERREYPLPGSTPYINKLAREDSERAIGRVCMAFQELDELLSCLIGRLISDDQQLGVIITTGLSFRNKIGLLSSLYVYRGASPELYEPFKALLARLHYSGERRNTFLHSYWMKSPACGMLIRYKYTAKSTVGVVPHTQELGPEYIEAITAEIRLVADDLILHFDKAFRSTATDKVLDALRTSREAVYSSNAETLPSWASPNV